MLEEESTEESRNRLGNLEELLNAAADAAERGETLGDFLDHAALVSDADQAQNRRKRNDYFASRNDRFRIAGHK